MSMHPVLIGGRWRASAGRESFQADNPALCEPLPDVYPVSSWDDCEAALAAAETAYSELNRLPAARLADFLERYAAEIEAGREALIQTAHQETALPVSPRLADVELPRTTGQLRQAAAAAAEGSWSLPTIDTGANIRSLLIALGPVCVFGPNNFPFAFNSIAGGDFAAAIAAGCPVIAKANPAHPGTTRLFAEAAERARQAAELPPGTVQLLYRTSHADGQRLVSDRRVGATAYTGSRRAGLKLKAAAEAAGKPIYLELSSINPVVLLPGALAAREDAIAAEYTGSCLLGAGQFCTNPGLVLLLAGESTESFIQALRDKFQAAPVGTLLSGGVQQALAASLDVLRQSGAELVVGGTAGGGRGCSFANTLCRVSGQQFLESSERLQTEAFGNLALLVVAAGLPELSAVLERLEGNLTGCIYSDPGGSDDQLYDAIAPALRRQVGRLLNDKMPTGVAVSPAMNHGGPYPATGHPGFTAVGIPAALRRFGMLACYDNVRAHRLPPLLQDRNPGGRAWRLIDGGWTRGDVAAG